MHGTFRLALSAKGDRVTLRGAKRFVSRIHRNPAGASAKTTQSVGAVNASAGCLGGHRVTPLRHYHRTDATKAVVTLCCPPRARRRPEPETRREQCEERRPPPTLATVTHRRSASFCTAHHTLRRFCLQRQTRRTGGESGARAANALFTGGARWLYRTSGRENSRTRHRCSPVRCSANRAC